LAYVSGNTYNWGTVPGVVASFASMNSVTGASGDTLVGGNAADTWSVTGKNSGQVGGVTFSGFSNLTGGSQPDTFAFVNGGTVTGTVNGGGGVNGLDYSGYTGDVTVNLPLGIAKLVGGVQNIRNIVGSVGNDVLVGNGTGNALTGGTGRNLLIAGGAPGTLLGGSDDDVLVGGATAYDSSPAALTALTNEWTRTDLPYGARVDHLLLGGGKNGSSVLNLANFIANAGGNTLTGAGGLDLFYGSVSHDANDWTPSIGEVFVGQDGIHGNTRITIGGLSVPVMLDGNVSLPANSSQPFTLAPSSHTITDSASGASVAFSVSGTVSYSASLEGVLSGAGTSTLSVHGVAVTIDATALAVPSLLVDGLPENAATPFVFTGLPGSLTLFEPNSGKAINITIKLDGTIDYVSSLDSILSGRSSSHLVIHGLPG
jgi:hypothetical protein